jgi:hypothetical protein
MENQSSNFNTLSTRLILRLGINKGSVRHTASPSVRLGIEALDQSN